MQRYRDEIKEIKEIKNNQVTTSGGLINFYELDDVKQFKRSYHNPHFDDHNIGLPFRMLIISCSGGGKTNFLLNLLHKFSDTFSHIRLITRNKSEQLYEYLESKLGKDELTVHEGLDEFRKMKLDQVYKDKSKQSLIIFDDMVQERDQTCIEELWLRGRKLGGSVSCIYLSQSYFETPKFLRSNSNYIVLKKLNGIRDIKLILSDYGLGATKEQLLSMYNECMGFRLNESDNGLLNMLLIDIGASPDKIFRNNWKNYLNPNDF
jgi:hypothetical protein